MRESPRQVWPVTHVAVTRVGADVVTSFVFADGYSDPRGVCVVMTPSAIRSAMTMFDDIVRRSSLRDATAEELSVPDRHIMARDPVHALSVDAVFAPDSDVMALCFRPLDYDETVFSGGAGTKIATTPSLLVAMSGSKFLGWRAQLGDLVGADLAEVGS